MDWSDLFNLPIDGGDQFVKAYPPEGVLDLAQCDVEKWHLDNCPAHDDQCESFFVEGAYAWTECDCEPRARAVRDAP